MDKIMEYIRKERTKQIKCIQRDIKDYEYLVKFYKRRSETSLVFNKLYHDTKDKLKEEYIELDFLVRENNL